MAWTSLCTRSELPLSGGKYVEIDGYRLAVFCDAGEVFVMDDACPHAAASLSAGPVVDGQVICPRHGWAFKLSDGELAGSPLCKVSTYRTRLFARSTGEPIVQADLPIP